MRSARSTTSGCVSASGKHARLADVVGRGEDVQVRRVVLQVAAVQQELAQHDRALGHLDAERRLERLDAT